MQKCALYAYFGEIGIFNDDIPGHSIYQLGLMDSISENYDVDTFDFYNYLDDTTDRTTMLRPIYPDGLLGNIFTAFSDRMIEDYRPDFDTVMSRINKKAYTKLFLKARFRNLATLAKKMSDAYRFETLIQYALSSGYKPEDIHVIDTDLSMAESFTKRLTEIGVRIVVPSISIPAIGQRFLAACMQLHREVSQVGAPRNKDIFYYGNLDFDNYKTGHGKNSIVMDVIESANHEFMFDQSIFKMVVSAKDTPKIGTWLSKLPRVEFIPRTNRCEIWQTFKGSLVSLNVSKDLYLDKEFIPARVYESIIMGVIPVSYKSSFHPAMSFETPHQFFEICKFLTECSAEDYYKILSKMAESV